MDSSDENGDDGEKQINTSESSNGEGAKALDDAAEDDALMSGGGSLENPPSPSFGDLLISKRTHQATAFEVCSKQARFGATVPLTYAHVAVAVDPERGALFELHRTREQSLAALAVCNHWRELCDSVPPRKDMQSGDARVCKVRVCYLCCELSIHSLTCSVLCFSLISPIEFQGDYRPYYTLYETDFDVGFFKAIFCYYLCVLTPQLCILPACRSSLVARTRASANLTT